VDELTTVRELLAPPPPPSSAVTALARQRLYDRIGGHLGPRGSGGSRCSPARSRPAWRGCWLRRSWRAEVPSHGRRSLRVQPVAAMAGPAGSALSRRPNCTRRDRRPWRRRADRQRAAVRHPDGPAGPGLPGRRGHEGGGGQAGRRPLLVPDGNRRAAESDRRRGGRSSPRPGRTKAQSRLGLPLFDLRPATAGRLP